MNEVDSLLLVPIASNKQVLELKRVSFHQRSFVVIWPLDGTCCRRKSRWGSVSRIVWRSTSTSLSFCCLDLKLESPRKYRGVKMNSSPELGDKERKCGFWYMIWGKITRGCCKNSLVSESITATTWDCSSGPYMLMSVISALDLGFCSWTCCDHSLIWIKHLHRTWVASKIPSSFRVMAVLRIAKSIPVSFCRLNVFPAGTRSNW